MHILFVTAEYLPLPGGVGAYTAVLGRTLAAMGCQVSVLTDARARPTDPLAALPVYPEITRWDWRIWPQVAAWAKRQQATWVHVQYQTGAYAMHPAINFAPRYWQWAARQTVRVAWTYHDLLPPYLFPKAGASLRRWVTELPTRTCDCVIVTNEADRVQLTHKTPNLVKIPIGSNIEGRLFTPQERAYRRRQRGYGPETLLIGYFGFLHPSKGGLTLVQTLDQLVQAGRNAHLLLIGEATSTTDTTNGAYRQTIVEAIAACGLQSRVQWTGALPEAEVSADLNACDVLLMPYEDGASLRRGTLMAGLAHGCAIVTTTPPGPLPELVAGRDLLFVAPRDATGAARAVAALADDPALMARVRTQAHTASGQFTWRAIAHSHLAVYEKVDR
jgi:glycosyltransferase involved in cell wall biosynthesis